MHWLSMILPGCCTKRQDSEEVKEGSVALPEINLMCGESLGDYLEIKQQGKEDEEGTGMNMKSQSTRSTNFSFDLTGKKQSSLGDGTEGVKGFKDGGRADGLYCGVCGQAAEGYCPACPFKRFCKMCFDDEHGEKMRIHEFVSYEKKRKLRNLSKMKMIFK